MASDIARVDRNQFHWDSKLSKFLAEASDLGFAPGDWPEEFEVMTQRVGLVIFKRGNATYAALDGGELVSYDYITEDGHQMTVLND